MLENKIGEQKEKKKVTQTDRTDTRPGVGKRSDGGLQLIIR